MALFATQYIIHEGVIYQCLIPLNPAPVAYTMAKTVTSPERMLPATTVVPTLQQPEHNHLKQHIDLGQLEMVPSCVLLTPETTPTKGDQARSEASGGSPEGQTHDVQDAVRSSNKATLSRSQSDSHLDSPKPTQCKQTRCINPGGEGLPPRGCSRPVAEGTSLRGVGRPKGGRTSRQGKKAPKVKAAGSTAQQATARSKSVPGDRGNREKQQELKTTLVTDYYPVRRSSRMTSTDLKKQQKAALEEAILSGSEDGLEVMDIDAKGRGVVATKSFDRGDFVVEYAGDLINLDEAKRRDNMYCADPKAGCYMYYFRHGDTSYCIDATAESGKLGRLLNHSKTEGNCKTRVVGILDRPYLLLVAARDIKAGEELLYDYGDRSKESLDAHPWLAL